MIHTFQKIPFECDVCDTLNINDASPGTLYKTSYDFCKCSKVSSTYWLPENIQSCCVKEDKYITKSHGCVT